MAEPAPGTADHVSLDPRKAAILTAIVREHVSYAEPVASQRLVERYDLGVSAATVRNEMAALEAAGYITQPHPSAGRIPTDLGYRFFVDAIDELRRPDDADPRALRRFLGQAVDLEDLLRRTTQLLTRLTRYASLVLAPSLDRSRCKLVEVVGLSPRVVLVVLIADTGRVEKRIVELPVPVEELDLKRARTVLNEAVTGLRMADVPGAVSGLAEGAPHDLRALLGNIVDAVTADLAQRTVDRVFVGGQAALAGAGGFKAGELHGLFVLLEEQATLGWLLTESVGAEQPVVRIGEENEPIEELLGASLVATGYGKDAPGSLGVVGPTRMNYPAVLAAVTAVADHLQETLRALTAVPVSPGYAQTSPSAPGDRRGAPYAPAATDPTGDDRARPAAPARHAPRAHGRNLTRTRKARRPHG